MSTGLVSSLGRLELLPLARRVAVMLLLGTGLGSSAVLADKTTTDAGNGSCEINLENSA